MGSTTDIMLAGRAVFTCHTPVTCEATHLHMHTCIHIWTYIRSSLSKVESETTLPGRHVVWTGDRTEDSSLGKGRLYWRDVPVFEGSRGPDNRSPPRIRAHPEFPEDVQPIAQTLDRGPE